jgi:hypothetical protein
VEGDVNVAGNELAHAQPGEHAVDQHGAGHGEEHDAVVAPDQLKPVPFRRLTVVAAFLTAIVLVLMALIGNHRGNIEKVFLIGIAGLIVLMVTVDVVLRRRGLRN